MFVKKEPFLSLFDKDRVTYKDYGNSSVNIECLAFKLM